MIKIKKNNYTCYIKDIKLYNSFNFTIMNDNNKFYNTELILITNSLNINHIIYWLYWHLNVIGFNHVFLVDNSIGIDYSQTIYRLFDKYVDYEKRPGILCQTEIYNELIKKSNAQWILPIDDDEFVYISDKFNNNINVFLEAMQTIYPAYKYAFNWHMMFSDRLLETNTNNYIDTFKYCSINQLALQNEAFYMVKTIINTSASHLYIPDNSQQGSFLLTDELNVSNLSKPVSNIKNNTIGSLHNPISKYNNKIVHAYNYETDSIVLGWFNNRKLNLNSDIYICHYKYRDKQSWINKCKKFSYSDVYIPYTSVNYVESMVEYVYNSIIPYLNKHSSIYDLAVKNNVNNKIINNYSI